jgi:sugar phosphate isomerase/epimerase
MKIQCSATLALGPVIPRFPYLYTGDLEKGCRWAAHTGFDAVELMLPSPDFISSEELHSTLLRYCLKLSAIATAGGWIHHKLHLCSPDSSIRSRAEEYIRQMCVLAGKCNSAVILGLMTGILEKNVTRSQALKWLTPALKRLSEHATHNGSRLLIEPLNRYESNLINRLEDGIEILEKLNHPRIQLLADFFHMNIEEPSISKSLQNARKAIGHLHFVDSNRCVPGLGHINFQEIAKTLRDIDYQGYAAIEALPFPDKNIAARTALSAFRKWLKN